MRQRAGSAMGSEQGRHIWTSEIRRDHTRRRRPPSTQTLLLGRLLGPVGVYGGRRPTRRRDGRACTCSLLRPSALRTLAAWGRASQTPESTHNAYPTRAAGRGRSPRLSGPGRVSPRPVFLAAGTALESSPASRRRRYRKSHVVRKCTQNYELARLQREEEGDARR